MLSSAWKYRGAVLAAALLVPVLGCNEDIQQPSAPEEAPPLSAEAAITAAVASNTWLVRADLPSTERYGPAVASVRNSAGQWIVYVIGGNTSGGAGISKVQAYNASTNTWSYKASLPVPLGSSNGAVAIGGKIYISGGRPNTHDYYASLYVYDPATNRWSRKADMPNSSAHGVSGAINGKLYVLTLCPDPEHGCSPNAIGPTLYRYDPATDRWSTRRSTRADGSQVYHPRGMAGVIGGKLYVVGGSFDVNELDVYDPVSDTWTSRAPLARGRFSGAGVGLNGKFYAIGGIGQLEDGSSAPVRTTSVYDPATNTWTNKRPMPSPRWGISGSTVVVNGQARVQVVGGARPGNNLAYVP